MSKSNGSAAGRLIGGFNFSVTRREAAQYAAECLILVLLSSVDKFGLALALGFFAGLVYARQNILILAPVLLTACLVFSFGWQTVLYILVPVTLLIILYAVFFRLKRNVETYYVALTLLIAMVPYAVYEGLNGGDIFVIVLSLVISVIFTFCSATVSYALLLRRINCRFTLEERICGGIMLAVFAYALCRADVYGFNVYFLAAGFLILLCADCFSPSAALFSGLLFGLGASLYFGDISLLGAAVVWAGIAVALSSFTRFASACGIVAADAVMWLLTAYSAAGWKALVMLGTGVVIYALLPKAFRGAVKSMSSRSNKTALNGIVNRNRGELSNKLYSVSDVFYDMSKTLDREIDADSLYTGGRLASEIAKNYCGRCADRETCFQQLGGDTASVLEPMANAALSRGRVTILDMPPFITGRCSKMHNLISVINSASDAYRKRRQEADGVEVGKKMMSEQFAGVALILDSLARDCGEQVSFNDELSETLSSELLRHNIVANEIVITGKESDLSAALTVRASDADKAVLPRIVSRRLKARLEVAEITNRGESRVVHLENSPVFEVAYGIAERKRGGEGVSGDSKSILCPSRRRRLFAISDGMGSGDAAAKASRDAIQMVENFYRAGFDNSLMLSLINKLLTLGENECFSSLDIAVIDTVNGAMDVIKLGAATSFIIRRDSIEELTSSAPPAGILDKVEPITSRYQLYDGDMVALMSDGVFDALDTKGVTDLIEELSTKNPQTLADALLQRAVENGAQDDCTALVLRIICT